jgi:hypothetical protein
MPAPISLQIPSAWLQIAAYAGHKDVRAWIRSVVDDVLETGPLRFVPILPLVWARATFKAVREESRVYALHEVSGWVSGPFGIYRGFYFMTEHPERDDGFTLTHLPTGRKIATLNRLRSCKRLAEELAPLRMGWHHSDAERTGGGAEDVAKATDLIRDYTRAAWPEPSTKCAGVGPAKRFI